MATVVIRFFRHSTGKKGDRLSFLSLFDGSSSQYFQIFSSRMSAAVNFRATTMPSGKTVAIHLKVRQAVFCIFVEDPLKNRIKCCKTNRNRHVESFFFLNRLRALVVSIFFLPSANGEKVCPPALRPSFPQTLIESGSSGPYIAGRFASVFNLTFRHFGRMTRSWFSLLFLSSSSLLRNHVERPRRSSEGIQLRVGNSALMPLVLLYPTSFPSPARGRSVCPPALFLLHIPGAKSQSKRLYICMEACEFRRRSRAG